MNGRPWVAIVLAGATSLLGAWMMLASMGVLAGPGSTRGHEWMGLVIGGVFCFGGAAAVLNQFPSPFTAAVSSGLALLVAAGLTTMFGYVAFGPGHHQISSPLTIFGPKVGEASGRIAFGFGAAMGSLICVLMLRSMLKRRAAPADQAPTSAV